MHNIANVEMQNQQPAAAYSSGSKAEGQERSLSYSSAPLQQALQESLRL
jgi:hypothetical protein